MGGCDSKNAWHCIVLIQEKPTFESNADSKGKASARVVAKKRWNSFDQQATNRKLYPQELHPRNWKYRFTKAIELVLANILMLKRLACYTVSPCTELRWQLPVVKFR